MIFGLMAIAGVAAGPTIIGSTPLRDTLLGWSMPVDGFRVESQSGAFAWLSGQTVADISITDPDGNPVLTAESIAVDRSLWSLASSNAGSMKLTIIRPVLYVATRADGSNLEDLIAAWSSNAEVDDRDTSDDAKLNVAIEIVEGTVRGFDIETQQQWRLSEANVSTQLGGDVEVSGGANLSISPDSQPGRVKFHLLQPAVGPQQLNLLTEQLPLEPFEPWLRRVLPGGRVAGTVSSDAKLSWTYDVQGTATLQTSGHLEANGLEVAAEALAGDRLRFESLVSPWQLSITREGISIEQLEAKTDWASFTAKGSLTFDEIRSFSFARLPKQEASLDGRVQLNRLATMLPHTLQLREGVQIDAGELEFSASGSRAAERFGWKAEVKARDVAGMDGRRPIRWEQPIEVALELVDTARGPQITQLAVSAPFADGNFKTSNQKIDGNFRFDLQQLSSELSQFVDLDDWQFRGKGEGTLSLTREQNDRFDAFANLLLTDLNVWQEGQLLWAESRLNVEAKAQGTATDFLPKQVVTSSIKLRGAGDVLEVELLEPVALGAAEPTYKVRVQGNGPLASWAGRLRPWITNVPAEIEGEAYGKATLQLAPAMVHVLESEGSIAQLRVRSGTLMIDEPRVQFAGDCRWERTNSSFAAQELQLVSSSLALRSRNLAVQLSSSTVPTATGQIAFRADLERLASIAGLVGQQEATWPRGMTTGTVELMSNAQHLQANFSANVEQLQMVRPAAASSTAYGQPELVWTEPELKIAGRATYLIADDRLQVEDVRLEGKTMQLSGRAILEKPTTEQQLQADGMLQYDSVEFAKLLARYLGPQVQVFGDRQIRFQVAGRLSQEKATGTPLHWSQRFNVTADAGWTSAAVYGLPFGAGRLHGTVADGQLQLAPMDLAVGQGRLMARPRAVLAPEPAYLFLPKGVLFSSVEISPQVSETMLKYVAPILAGATRTSGKFSLDIDDTRVPLVDPRQAHVAGRLTVHRLNVSPGPMMVDLVRLVKQIEVLSKQKQLLQTVGSPARASILSIDNRQIEFQVAEGRVYHRNLEFIVDGVPVRSQGSVGFDQTLALVIEIPIQEKWIEKERMLRSLAGQSIQIPVRGTFQKPRIDERAVANLSRQLLQGVATEAIGGEINRALDKLFKSR